MNADLYVKVDDDVYVNLGFEQDCVPLNEVDMSTNIRKSGARVLAQVVIAKSGSNLVNFNANYISNEVDEINDMFKISSAMLASLDDNDQEGEDYNEDVDEASVEDEHESKLKGLEIKYKN
ncbi:hypothetical protein AgCh_009967 [Apium graveolens]